MEHHICSRWSLSQLYVQLYVLQQLLLAGAKEDINLCRTKVVLVNYFIHKTKLDATLHLQSLAVKFFGFFFV